MTPQLFRKGQRVRFSAEAYKSGIVKKGSRFDQPGRVVAYPARTSLYSVKVQRDGFKTANIYHVTFWEPVTLAARRRRGIV